MPCFEKSFSGEWVKRLDKRTFMYATPTLITEALRLITRVQLFLTTVTVNYYLIQC